MIDRVEAPNSHNVATWIGKRLGPHCTALGKALISQMSPTELDQLIHRRGLVRYNENTITSKKKLEAACADVRQLGYAVDDEEEEIGVVCIGAPIVNGKDGVIAAISISGVIDQVEDLTELAVLVKRSAAAVAHHIQPLLEEAEPFISHNM